VINLLEDLQKEFGLTYLFISHDLSVVEHISDRVAVMYLGKLVELADSETLYKSRFILTLRRSYQQHLYLTLNEKNAVILSGDVPSPIDPPTGCPFPYPVSLCKRYLQSRRAAARRSEEESFCACLFVEEVLKSNFSA